MSFHPSTLSNRNQVHFLRDDVAKCKQNTQSRLVPRSEIFGALLSRSHESFFEFHTEIDKVISTIKLHFL
jgi:hypothetical protein